MAVNVRKSNARLSRDFVSSQFDCRGDNCTALTYMNNDFISMLQRLRDCIEGYFGRKAVIEIVKGYTCTACTDGKEDVHSFGKAADIRAYCGNEKISARTVCLIAEECGFPGIIFMDEYTAHVDTRIGAFYRYDAVKNTVLRGFRWYFSNNTG